MKRIASSIVAGAIALFDPRPCRAVPGDVNGDDKLNLADPITLLYYLFCGGELKSPDPFCAELQPYVLVDNGDGTVSDLTTNLMWQKAEARLEGLEQAISYCLSLDLAGYDDWRLPNIRELLSVNQGKWYFDDNWQDLPPPPPLEGTESSGYVSSSAIASACCYDPPHDSRCVWGIYGRGDFYRRSIGVSSIGRVRPVRGGLAASVGDTNADGRIDIGDAITLLYYLFQGGRRPEGPTRLLATGVTQSLLPGDDGDLRVGLPLAYRDNGDGTVTDMNTGLVWDQKPPVELVTASEMGSQYAYYLIPTYADVLTVVDFSRAPAIAREFELGEGVWYRFWIDKVLWRAQASLDVYCLKMWYTGFPDFSTARVWTRRP